MDDEIDLRQYFEILWRRRYLIAGVALAAALIAGLLSVFVLKPVYEASALLLIAKPRFQIPATTATASSALPAISTDTLIPLVHNEVVAAQVLRRTGGDRTPQELVSRVTLSPARGTDFLRVTARDTTPSGAEALARGWSETIVSYVDTQVLDDARRTFAVLEQKLGQAREELAQAENDLLSFQSTTKIPILAQRVQATSQRIAFYELRLVEIEQSGAAMTREVFLGPSGNTSVLTVTSLRDPRQVRQVLAAFRSRLAEDQAALAAEQQKETQLIRRVEVARSTYQPLAQEASRRSLDDFGGMVQVVVPASRPASPAAPRTSLNIVLGGMLGLTMGTILAFVLESFRPVTRTIPHPAGHRTTETPVTQD